MSSRKSISAIICWIVAWAVHASEAFAQTNQEFYIKRLGDHCEWYLNHPAQGRGDWWKLIQAAAQRNAGSTTSAFYRQRVAEHCEWYLKNNGNNRPDWWELIQAAAKRDAGNTQPPFTITFYVDLNANNKVGHVFVAVSIPDGSVEYRGYYPKHSSPYDIGDLKDDRNHHYDVKKHS